LLPPAVPVSCARMNTFAGTPVPETLSPTAIVAADGAAPRVSTPVFAAIVDVAAVGLAGAAVTAMNPVSGFAAEALSTVGSPVAATA
jgi:hypothetical protein